MAVKRSLFKRPLIEELAIRFRDGIDAAMLDGRIRLITFRDFPHGSCDDASDLLARYLMERGIRTTAMSGSYRGEFFEDFQSHTWLLDDWGFALDITGDQFRNSATFLNFRTKVYYGPEGEFHMLFKDRRPSTKVGIFEQYNEPARSSLFEAYNTILQYL